MSPAIVLKDGEPVLSVGAAGGPKIITQALLTIIRRLDFGQSLAEAVAAPRFHHQWRPEELTVERTMPAELVKRLEAFGHEVEKSTAAGVTQAVERGAEGNLVGVHDPRVPGKAASGRRRAK